MEIEIGYSKILLGVGVIAILSFALSLFSTYQILTEQPITRVTESGEVPAKKASTSNLDSKIQQVKEEVLPEEGSPTGYGVKYSTAGIQTLVNWFQSTSLSGDNKDRYIKLGTTDGTACEYCCGASKALRSNGQSACGCKHNYALAGLIKYLVKNTDKTNEEILKEVHDWKGYFFPKQTLSKELQKRGISPEAAGLPQMRGGC